MVFDAKRVSTVHTIEITSDALAVSGFTGLSATIEISDGGHIQQLIVSNGQVDIVLGSAFALDNMMQFLSGVMGYLYDGDIDGVAINPESLP